MGLVAAMQAQLSVDERCHEQGGYFTVPGAHLYSVLHQVTDPKARVLLVGAFASERHFSYHCWVRWARYLAARGVEVLRYDYRGVGESTGVFEELSFDDWREDIQILSNWLARRSPSIPLILHGLEMGSILAGRCFHEGIGDALLLWSPANSANRVLRSILQRWAGLEQIYESPQNRKTTSEYVRQIEQGASIEVQGYQWSSRLWADSFHVCLPAEMENDALCQVAYKKPVKVVKFGSDNRSIAVPYIRYDEAKDLTDLYAANFKWLAGVIPALTGGVNEASS
jgi:hypothetical protein